MVVHRFVDALNQQNWAELVGQFFSTPADYEQFKKAHSQFRAAFTDYHFTIDGIIAQGDTVVTLATVTATHMGDFPFAEFKDLKPTGKNLKWKEISIDRMIAGKFAGGWMMADIWDRMQQLGLKCCLQETKR